MMWWGVKSKKQKFKGAIKQNSHAYAMINDAVHGVMSFPEEYKDLLKSLIDSETFQRLRHIKQLGMTDLIFPTAVHNRFSHCLGAAHVAWMISNKLRLEEDEKKYAMVGALLHDIGHGPFSHAFEKFLLNKESQKIKHEHWTSMFIKEFQKQLEKYDINYEILSSLIQSSYDKSSTKYNLASDIISSQLDADRLDYLLRDAHFCGVPYGNPDLLWIINHATIVQQIGEPPRIGFLRKGWRAVEHFLLCRRMMTQNVYHHHKKNVFERLLVEFLIKVSENKNIKRKMPNNNLRTFLTNAFTYRQSHTSSKEFIQDNFNYYKTLTDYDIWMLIRDFASNTEENISSANKIAQRIYHRNAHFSFPFEETCLGAVSSVVEGIKEDLSLEDWQIFVTENDTTAYETQNDPILIVDEVQGTHRIQKYSSLLSILGDKHEKEGYLAIDVDLWEAKRNIFQDRLKKYISFVEATEGIGRKKY